MALILSRVPGTAIFINSTVGERPWETRTALCFYDAKGTAGSAIAFGDAMNAEGSFAFVPRNPLAPFRTLEKTMRNAVTASVKLLVWTDPDWGAFGDDALKIANGATAAPLDLRFWDFTVLRDIGNGEGALIWSCPAGAQVTLNGTDLVVSSASMRLVNRVGGEADQPLPLQGNTARLSLEPSQKCGLLSGSLDAAPSSQWLALLTPHVRYRWDGNPFPVVKSAGLLSASPTDHQGVNAHFELHPFDRSLKSTRVSLEAARSTSRLQSSLTGTTGHLLGLTPAEGAAIYFEAADTPSSYPSLKGQFKVLGASTAVPAGGSAALTEVMPGGAGTEFFQLHGEDGFDGLEFLPGQGAFVRFGDDAHPPDISADQDETTSWIRPCRTGAMRAWATSGYKFVAQPEEQPLYGRRNKDSLNQPITPSTVLFDPAPRTLDATPWMPFFPVRGVLKADLEEVADLDLHALGHVRALLAAKSTRAPQPLLALSSDDSLTRITTPDGLLVDVDADNNWHRIILGGKEDDWKLEIPRPMVGNSPVRRWALQEALSRAQPFVVIGEQLGAPQPALDDPVVGDLVLAIRIGGWPMEVTVVSATPPAADPHPAGTLPPVQYPGSRPVLVLKLRSGALADGLANVSTWALAQVFNSDPGSVSKNAVDALGNLGQLARGESPVPLPQGAPAELKKISAELVPQYKSLYEKITDPAWTGVLVFNAATPLNGVPGHVAVITQGDNVPSAFGVPVLGIDVNRVVPQDSGMRLEKTSAFGAIHYHSPEPLKEHDPARPGFAFKVRGVNAIFQNTSVRAFLASMQLRLSEYFGEESKHAQSAGNSRLIDIVGRYEGKAGAAGREQYVFRALGRRTMEFEGKGLLSAITVTRIDVTSRWLDDGKTIESRFGMWGELDFGDKFSAVTGVRKISFGNAGLILRGSTFEVDAGDVRIEFDKTGNSNPNGLLAKFPFQLSALRWAPRLMPLDGVGFTRLALPGFPDLNGTKFEFGIELDLNLGSMGKLFEAAEFLKARILVGWNLRLPQPEFSIGFRFMGGNGPLDIGINGVMRLTAEAVLLKTYDAPDPAGIGIGLLKPQLEVMGYKVPKEPKDTLVAFLPAGKDNVAWAWARRNTDVDPVKLDYFAIGQRINLVPPGAWGTGTTLQKVIDASIQQMQPTQNGSGVAKLPNIGALYTPEAGWGVVARGSVSAFNFRFVFMDGIDRYGLGVDIPQIAKVDVLYRKLSDGVGVFSAEIEPAFRSIEVGAATITLPIVGFDAVTNGGWSINIGYHGNDFSRGTTVQVLPFLGSGGVRFGRLDWRTSYVLNSPDSTRRRLIEVLALSPVIEMSLAARVGIGKELREGVFSAGITLSVYGIFEGALGTPTDPNFPAGVQKRYIKIHGAAGILLEIYGSVNFAIVSAAVSIRVWVETGITFETWAPVIVHAEAGVSVYVHFVIARFSVFGHTVEIAIDFSFATRVRITQKITDSFDGDLPDVYKNFAARTHKPLALIDVAAPDSAAPLEWNLHRLATSPVRQDCAVTLEPMISDGKPVLMPMLVASAGTDAPGLAQFAVDLFTWSLRLSMGIDANAPTPDRVGLADLKTLQARLDLPPGKTLSRWGNVPLDFAHLQDFLAAHLVLALRDVAQLRALQAAESGAAPQTPQGILLPWFADLALCGSADDAPERTLRDFRGADATEVDASWEQELYQRLSASRPEYPPADATQAVKLALLQAGAVAFQAGGKNALDVVVEDWAGALVHGIVHRAAQVAEKLAREKNADSVAFAELSAALLAVGDEGSPALQTVQHASTFLHHGLRVPPAPIAPGGIALPELLKTEVGFAELAAGGTRWQISSRPRSAFAGSWLSGSSSLPPFDAAAGLARMGALVAALDHDKIQLDATLEDDDIQATTRPRRFSMSKGLAAAPAYSSVATMTLLPLPRTLISLLQRKGALQADPAFLDPKDKVPPEPCKRRWFARIELRLGAPRSVAPGAPASYPLLNADGRIRDLLNAIQLEHGARIAGAWLAFGADQDAPQVPLRLVTGEDAFIVVANFSREPAPDQGLRPLKTGGDDTPAYASLAMPDKLAQVLWMAATVNAPGFELVFRKGNPIGHLFKRTSVASIDVVFELDTASRLLPAVDGMLVDSADHPGWNVVVETPDVRELMSATPDGQVAVVVRRKISRPLGPLADDVAALAARYELADYRISASAASLTGNVSADLDRASVVPVRVTLSEEERLRAAVSPLEWWPHRLLVPLSRIAETAAKRKGTPAAVSPYEFVGIDVRDLVVPGLRDGAGHYLDDGKTALSWTGGTRLLYRDTLPQLQEMPGVTAKWQLAHDGAGPRVLIDIAWSASTLALGSDDGGRKRAALLQQFTRWSLMFATSDFRAQAQVTFAAQAAGDHDLKPALRNWLAEIIDELKLKTDRDRACPQFAIALSPATLPSATPTPCPMEVDVTLTRDPNLCDQRLGDPDIGVALSPVVPLDLQSVEHWDKWAQAVALHFDNRFMLVRRLRPRSSTQADGPDVPVVNLVLTRMLERPAHMPLQAAGASFYAPTPVAKTLRSGTAAVRLPEDQRQRVDANEVDLNALAARASSAIEAILEAGAASAMCLASADSYSRVAAAKRRIAEAISDRLWAIVVTGSTISKGAHKKFANASRANLRVAFAPAAVVEVQLVPSANPAPKVFLWGRIEVVAADPKQKAALSFSPVSMPLGDHGPEGQFDFVVSWADPGVDPLAVLQGPMRMRPQYVEVQGDQDRNGYRPSDWFEVIWASGPTTGREFDIAPPAGSVWNIPLPLRLIPATPNILRHSFVPGAPEHAPNLDEYVKRARGWSYVLASMMPATNHDTTRVTVRFDDTPIARPLEEDALFEALVAFSYHEKTIAAVTEQYVAGKTPNSLEVKLMVEVFEAVAVALQNTPAALLSAQVTGHTRIVTVGRQPEEGGTSLRWEVKPAEYQPIVSAALLEFSPENAGDASHPVAPDSLDPAHGVAFYKDDRPEVRAAFKGGAGLSPRQVQLSGLDVMLHGSAMPHVKSLRNAHLLRDQEVTISDAFIFETPAVETPDPLIPHLVYGEAYDMSTGSGGSKPLVAWLAQLRDALLHDANAAAFTLDVSARFRLPLVQGAGTQLNFFVPLPSLKEADPAGGIDWATVLAGYLHPAVERLEPATRDGGTLELKVQIFHASSAGQRRPALSLQKLELPLSRISLKPSLPGTRKSLAAPPPYWRIAAYVFARMRGIRGAAQALADARMILADFALTLPDEQLERFKPPRIADLAGYDVHEWASSNAAAGVALAQRAAAGSYALVEWAPAGSHSRPAAGHVPWLMTALANKVVRLAGPMRGRGTDDLFLWGLPR